MLQLRKKILVGVLCSALVLSTSQSVAWSETVEVPTEAGAADAVTAEAADAAEDAGAEEETEAPVTQEQALADCVLYAETDTLEMHVNESNGIFAIKDKATGEYWWSNPYAADSDPIAKGSNLAGLKSALVIDSVKVTDTEAPETPLKSYADAVQKGTFSIEKIENGFKAVCTFTGEGLTVPYNVTLVDDYFEINVPIDEIIEEEMNGNTSESVRSVVTLSLFKDLGAGNGDEDSAVLSEVALGCGAVSQRVGHLRQLHAVIVKALQQRLAILVEPLGLDDEIEAVYRQQHIGVNLQPHRTERQQHYQPQAYHHAEAGSQCADICPAAGIDLLFGRFKGDHICYLLPYQIVAVGYFQIAALRIQYDGVAIVTFHYQIGHASSASLLFTDCK